MSRDLRQYLKYPDKLFRRVRDEHGQLQLSRAAKSFNPGMGVYRSSYKNAMRLARTETNMAYRTSDYTRWQQLDFVVGIEIRTSNNHPIADICDELAGRYPKDFKFTGWHPQCRCHAVSVLKTPEEMTADNERIMNGEELNGESVNRVDDVPESFNRWMINNEKRLTTANSMPYFISENPKYTGVTLKKGIGAYTGTKLGREATKAARREYESAEITKLTEAQSTNINELSKSLKTKANPMDFNAADNGRANVNYKAGTAFWENCQSCVVVHEARLRGLNITSIGYDYSDRSIQEIMGKDSSFAWINPKTGLPPQISKFYGRNDDERFKWVNTQTKAIGRYHIGVNLNAVDGHIFTAERLSNGKILFYDPQKNEFLKIEELVGVESFEVLKVDKLLFNKKAILSISELL